MDFDQRQYDPDILADAGSALWAGPTASLTGLPVMSIPSFWRSRKSQPSFSELRPQQPFALQGSGTVLIYDAEDRLLGHLPAWLYLTFRDGASSTGPKVNFAGLKRNSAYYSEHYDNMYDRNFGIPGGVSVAAPELTYALSLKEATTDSDDHLFANSSAAVTLRSGRIAKAYLLLTTDGYGEAVGAQPTLADLDTVTPETLSATDSDVVWMQLPLSSGQETLVTASSLDVEESSRLILKDLYHFSVDTMEEGRAEAAFEAFKDRLYATETYHRRLPEDTEVFANNCRWNTQLRAYGTEARSAQQEPVIEEHLMPFTYHSAAVSSVTLPPTGKYYFEVKLGGAYWREMGIGIGSLQGFRSWYGRYGNGLTSSLYLGEANHSPISGNNLTVRVLVDRDTGEVSFKAGDYVLSHSYVGSKASLRPEDDRVVVYYDMYTNSPNKYGSATATLKTQDTEFLYDRPMGYQCLPELKDRRHQTGPYPYEEVMDWLSAQASDANYPVKADRTVPDAYQFARESVIQSALSLPDTGKFYFEVDLPTDVGYPLAEGETEVTTGNPYATLALVPEGFAPSFEQDMRATGYATFHLADHLDEAMAAGTLKVLVDQDAGTVSWQLGELTIDSGSFTTTAIPEGSASRIMAGIVGAGQAGQYGTLRFRFKEEDFTGTLPEGYQPVPWSFSRA